MIHFLIMTYFNIMIIITEPAFVLPMIISVMKTFLLFIPVSHIILFVFDELRGDLDEVAEAFVHAGPSPDDGGWRRATGDLRHLPLLPLNEAFGKATISHDGPVRPACGHEVNNSTRVRIRTINRHDVSIPTAPRSIR